VLSFDRESLKGRTCVGGLDLASTSDFTAWILLFSGTPDDPDGPGFTVLPHFFVPRHALEKRAPMRTLFDVWVRNGLISVHEGQTTDYDAIEDHIENDATMFRIRSFGYDQWNATQVVGHLENRGLVGVKVPQSAARLNDSTKRLETLIAERKFHHGGNPVLRWHFDNVELDVTGDGLVKPSKAKSGEKIDGVAATVNALFVEGVPVEETPEVTFISFDEPEPLKDGRPLDAADELIAALLGDGERGRQVLAFGDGDDDEYVRLLT